ncbi:MAG: response regulator [Ktedonobacteraceae bacterium]|nr:response regulator [Ktedonobacteraceae bacterium]
MEPSERLSKKLFIVVIDDSTIVCTILETILTPQGHQVRWFLDPVAALRSMLTTGETPLPDLLFIDISLPRINGYEVIKRFRNNPTFKRIPIVVISRLDDTVARLKARLAGANAYLAKPFQIQDVLTLVEDVTTLPNPNTHENE